MSSFFFSFVTENVRKFELARAFFGQRTEKNVRISEKFELLEFELYSTKQKFLNANSWDLKMCSK